MTAFDSFQASVSPVKPELPFIITATKFLCPKCGCVKGYFGTFTFHEMMARSPESKYYNKGYVTGDQIGYCTAEQHSLGKCDYQWVRSKESDEKHFIKETIVI